MIINIKIDNTSYQANPNETILQVALKNDIYIPHLCSHPDLPIGTDLKPIETIYHGTDKLQNPKGKDIAFEGCQLCLVEVKGIAGLQRTCQTLVKDGMQILTDTPEIKETRQKNLSKILAQHPHACLTCAQQEGCSLTQCSTNVPEKERCCPKFGRCELQKIAQYIGIKPDTPKYSPQNLSVIETDPLFIRDYNLCIGCTRCVHICKEVKGVDALGFIYQNDNTVIVGSKGPNLKESDCKFCGACIEVCPTGALRDKDIKPGDEREKYLVPCKHTCPIGLDVPSYIRSIKEDKPAEALKVISLRTPFPRVLGRVCFHPCEEVCRRKDVNEPIAICALKRFAADSAKIEISVPSPNPSPSWEGKGEGDLKSQRIAVIGAGPTGLTAAYYLARLGYPITIFEAQPEPGGMMRYAIPEYRLPLDVLEQDLDSLKQLKHIIIKTNQILGKDFTLESLKKDGFNGILVAIGAQASKKLKIDGIETPGVIWGIDFLKAIRSKHKVDVAKNVLVIGGGNVAIDVALSAKRLGAAKVQLACLESESEMPAHKWEIDQAREEGVIMHPSWGPNKIIHNNNKIIGVAFSKCTCVFDQDNKFNPSFNPSICKNIETEMVIIAIGQDVDAAKLGLELNPNQTVKVKEDTLATNQTGIFAGGEIVHNPGSVVDAIADGRKAAIAIDKYLGGKGEIDESLSLETPKHNLGEDKKFGERARIKMPALAIDKRLANFMEIETGYDKSMAQHEAGRCLQCDLRLLISPITLPPEKYLVFNTEALTEVPETEGVFKLLDEKKEIIMIKGIMNLKQGLTEQLESNPSDTESSGRTCKNARYFEYEEDKMFTKRESELIQHFLQQHGKLPGGGSDELDDLF